MSFIADLRQRRLVQIFLTFLAGSWIVLEAIDQLVNNDVLPLLAYQLALVAFLAGVPAALIIGWFHGERGHQQAPKIELVMLSVLAIGAVAGGWRVVSRAQVAEVFASASELDTHSLAIMYFEAADDQTAPLAAGLTEALISQFERVPSLNVVSRNGVAMYRDSEIEADSIARLLDVGTIIQGSVEQRGDEIRATITLVDGGSGIDFRRERFDWPMENVLTAQEDLAGEVSQLLRDWLGEEVDVRASREETESVGAWLLVQQAEREIRQATEALDHGEVEAGRKQLALADSIAAEARAADAAWPAPALQQARIDYRMARSYDNDPLNAEPHHQASLTHLAETLAMEGRNAEALELRGRVNYVRWLLGLEPDHDDAEALLASAEEDLLQATRLNPRLASAFSLLAHLASQRDDITQANLFAAQAYDADAFLSDAQIVLWRLFHTSYDLENFSQARRWCIEGNERFPEDETFLECQLWMMTAGATEADADAAWVIADRIGEVMGDHAEEDAVLNAHILVAGAIARAGLPDSARAVLDRSRGDPQIDPTRELLLRQAFVYATILEDEDAAIENLREYLTANPDRIEGFREHGHWWWRGLRSNEDFQRLIGS
jgi:serine/threonine-protein kinase